MPLAGALLWSVLVLSIGAISLLFLLIRRGAARSAAGSVTGGATQVASLMYLTPAVTALMAWVLFGEPITPLMVAGMVVTAVGVTDISRAASHLGGGHAERAPAASGVAEG
ncbi:MAG: hypothetical protein H0W23_09220 [Chloroflexia bacterium]|nr:hypothetical protein [Chloroflexia bacterium]